MEVGADRSADVDRLESILTDGLLADRVEMVARHLGGHVYRVSSVTGSVEFERDESGGNPTYRVKSTTGVDPLADQVADRWVDLESERNEPQPSRAENSYPHAFDGVAQFFDSPVAPELVATHTSAHAYGASVGRHGSLGLVQARAPFIASGRGLLSLGALEQSTRMVNLAPTLAALLDLEPHPEAVGPTSRRRPDAFLRRQDGDPESQILSGDRPDHVVVVLLDGCNPNVLHDVIATGEAPNIAALAEGGTMYRHGVLASFPTATLANHTTALTGAHPGHSGVLHNTWLNRGAGSEPDLLALDQMFWASQHLADGVETIFEAIERSNPGEFTVATFEYCDRGAAYSTFAGGRAGTLAELPPEDEVVHLDPDAAAASKGYRFMSRVDHLSLADMLSCWRQEHGSRLPLLSWCSLALTDATGHESGPHSDLARSAVRDSDARLGEIVSAVERAGVMNRTAFFVIGDHGMQQGDPDLTRPWEDDLTDTGVAHRIVGEGLVYLL